MTWTDQPTHQRPTTVLTSHRWTRRRRPRPTRCPSSQLLLSTASVEEFLADLAQPAAQSMTPAVSCGITLHHHHDSLTVASSDALAAAVDEVQYGQDDGPCLEAMRTGVVVSVTDVATERRWGSYPGTRWPTAWAAPSRYRWPPPGATSAR